VISDKVREEGFEVFKKGLVRRLSQTHFVAKAPTAEAWQLVELKHGKWVCDCQASEEWCVHLYAALLHRSTSKLQQEPLDEEHLKCRHCGSPDIVRCGFRYNAHGIARRYRCNDCQRKFSIPHIQTDMGARPLELVWLLNEIGMLTSKLTDLLTEVNDKMELAKDFTENLPSNGSSIHGSESDEWHKPGP
jgi:DNA-directed RNA polymerase subunit RPC12/RpoP